MKIPGHFLLFASMTLVGSYVALSKPLVAAMPVMLLAWLRFGIAAIAMMPSTLPRELAKLDRSVWKPVFLQSFFGNFLFSICMLNGVAHTSATASGVIMATLPATVAIFSRIMLKERIGRRTIGAIALAVCGISILAFSRHDDGTTSLLGNLLMLGAVCCEALYVVIGKHLASRLPPLKVSALINLVGLLLITPFGLWEVYRFNFGGFSGGLWALLIFYSLSASLFAVWLWMSGLKQVPANHAGVFTIALPLASTLIGVLFLGEAPSWTQLLALGLAVSGILLTAWPARLTPASAPVHEKPPARQTDH